MCKFTHFFACESYECELTICYNQQVARSSAKVQNYRSKAPPVKTQGGLCPPCLCGSYSLDYKRWAEYFTNVT